MNNSRETMKENDYSQITAMFAIARASLRSITRSPSAVVFSLGFPLVFIIAFGFINGGKIKMDVGLKSGSDTTTILYRQFTQLPNISIEKDLSQSDMESHLQKGRLDAIVFFDKDDQTGGEKIKLITSKASREKAMFVQTVLSNIVDKYNLEQYKTAPQISQVNSASFEQSFIQGREYKTIDFILPGQLGFSILSAGVFGTAFVFFSLRQTLVLKRFFATPVKRTYIVLGETLSRLVFQLAGSAIILIFGKFIFGFTLINGWITAVQMLVLAALGLIVFMGFGFVVSGLAKNESVIPPIANIITLPQFLLSGTFFPVDAFPGWLQYISKILPLTYLNDALRKVAFEGAGFGEISIQIGVVVVWGIVAYAAAVRLFRWE